MKKIVIKIAFNVCIIFLLIQSLLILIFLAQQIHLNIKFMAQCHEELNYYSANPGATGALTIQDLQNAIVTTQQRLSSIILYLTLSCLAVLSCIFIFVYSNPKLFRKSTYTDISAEWAKNKAERAASRSVKAEAEKQKQIAELEQKLNELKKDE